ncbi:MAG: alpha/beta fold hydrolase [Ruminococcaceae bacterium]|jgi:alpha-beta hydrolase superfamily lysophospholipase|nr:alpha/beta fold hydrolase [Oscillospiraceae bacterium]
MNIELMTCERRDRGKTPWTLSVARILPERRPRFCVQLLHGFSERKERWFSLMQFIAACGGVVLAHDLRGHGASAPSGAVKHPEDGVADLGYDYGTLMDDIDEVYSAFGDPWGEKIPDPAGERLLPRFLFGHSMGALMAAAYAARRSRSIDGLILSGLPHKESMVSAALFGLGFRSLFTGDAACPKGLNRKAFDRYNGYFIPEPGSDGQFLWLANDPAVREAFAADPLCNRPHPLGDYRNLLRLVRDVWKPSFWDKPSDIPVLLMAGEKDPIAGGDDWMIYAGKFLSDMGFASVDERMYRNLRHEIFMDEGRQSPFADMARFCLTNLPGKRAASEAQRTEPAPTPRSEPEPEPAASPEPESESEVSFEPEAEFAIDPGPESAPDPEPTSESEALFDEILSSAPDTLDASFDASDSSFEDWDSILGTEFSEELPEKTANEPPTEQDAPDADEEIELILGPDPDRETGAKETKTSGGSDFDDELLFLGEDDDGEKDGRQ